MTLAFQRSILLRPLAVITLLLAASITLLSPPAHAESEQAILAIVNDEPITVFNVNQRIAFMVISSEAVDERDFGRHEVPNSTG